LITSTDLNSIKNMPLFADIPESRLERILEEGVLRPVEPGQYLFFQGDEAERLYVLLEGRLRLSQVTPEGQQVILRYVAPGEAFGVVAALSGAKYPASAETVENSRIISWDQGTIRQAMTAIPEIALNALGILAKRIKEFQDRVRELSTERVERRIARALIRLARQVGRKTEEGLLIDLPLSRQDLAEMTGTTLYTVSRTLSQWESQGLISSRREQVLIRFPHGLVAIAEDLPNRALDGEDEPL
jgi:CRP-like cAMP-binding protein